MTTNTSIEDFAHVSCEELHYLPDGYGIPTGHVTVADHRYEGMTAKEIAKCERWVHWAALKAELAAIHAEVEGRISASSLC